MSKRAILVLCLCLLPWAAWPADDAKNWPQWRGPNRDGKSADTGLLKQWADGGPKKVWSVPGMGEGFSSPAVANGVIYISGEENRRTKVMALGLDGKQKWSRTLCPAFIERRGNGPRATITVDGDRLYFLAGKGDIFCLNTTDGKTVWKRNMREFGGRVPHWGYSESILVYKDLTIMTPGGKSCMVALDKKTGRTVWTSKGLRDKVHYCSAIAVEQDGVAMVIQGTGNSLIGVGAKDGALLWRIDWPGRNTANCPTPAYEDGYVFWSIGYGKGAIGVTLNVKNGKVDAKQIYHTKNMVSHHGGYVINKGYVYGNHGGGWVCLDLKTGAKKWNQRGVGKGSLCYADGMLYTFAERRGECGLVEATPKGFKAKGLFSVNGTGNYSWAHPIVAGGRLYLRYGDKLHCFDVTK